MDSIVLKDAQFLTCDVETTGVSTKKDRIVELALALVDCRGRTLLDPFVKLCNPGRNIPHHVAAINGINDKMVADKPPVNEVFEQAKEWLGDSEIHAFVGHNVKFDAGMVQAQQMLGGVTIVPHTTPTLCTMRFAMHMFPDNRDGFKLQELKQVLELVPHVRAAHEAGDDMVATVKLFEKCMELKNWGVDLAEATVSDLLKFVVSPIDFKFMPIGKHKGEAFEELPVKYLKWAAGNISDPDLKLRCAAELKKRV